MSLIFDSNNKLVEGRIHSCSGDEFIQLSAKVRKTKMRMIEALIRMLSSIFSTMHAKRVLDGYLWEARS